MAYPIQRKPAKRTLAYRTWFESSEKAIAAYISDVISIGKQALINEAFKNVLNPGCRR